MKNWKTTLSALVVAAAGFILFSPETFVRYPIIVQIAKYIAVGGVASLGLSAKDSTTHSTVAEVAAASPDNVSSLSMSSSVTSEVAASQNPVVPEAKP